MRWIVFFFFSSRRRHTRFDCDWSSDVCSSDLLFGPTPSRLPDEAARRGEVALTFDDGPDPEVTPRVLDLLDRAGAKATFFCIGRRVEARPDLAAEIVRRGLRIGDRKSVVEGKG